MSILIEEHAIEKIGEVCRTLGRNALIVSGKTTIKIAGNKVCDVLSDYNTEIVITESILKKDADEIEIGNNDFIVGVGGGRVIDVAKYVAFIPQNRGNNAHDGSTDVIAYTEAALYAGDKIFSMRTFPARTKEGNLEFKITWSITF